MQDSDTERVHLTLGQDTSLHSVTHLTRPTVYPSFTEWRALYWVPEMQSRIRQRLVPWQKLRQQMDVGALMDTAGCDRESGEALGLCR